MANSQFYVRLGYKHSVSSRQCFASGRNSQQIVDQDIGVQERLLSAPFPAKTPLVFKSVDIAVMPQAEKLAIGSPGSQVLRYRAAHSFGSRDAFTSTQFGEISNLFVG